jgi:hypothetical protein
MARIKTSALISDISGKVGGSVFQRNQGGLSLRQQSGKINSNTLRSNIHRVNTSTIQTAWQSLTDDERNLWNTYAIYLGKKQKKNSSLLINGHQLFLNINSLRMDLAPDNGLFTPAILTTPILAPLPEPINIVSIERDGVALKINLDRAISNVYNVIICYLSRPIRASQMSAYIKMTLMKAPTNSGTDFECNAYYTGVYGRVPEVDEWLQTKIAIYDNRSENYSSYSVKRTQVF